MRTAAIVALSTFSTPLGGDDTGENYNRYRDKFVAICPSCLDQAAQDHLAAATASSADSTLGTLYCAE